MQIKKENLEALWIDNKNLYLQSFVFFLSDKEVKQSFINNLEKEDTFEENFFSLNYKKDKLILRMLTIDLSIPKSMDNIIKNNPDVPIKWITIDRIEKTLFKKVFFKNEVILIKKYKL
jgi:hypothetical protein